MQPTFTRINHALHNSFEYYNIDRIRDYLIRFSGKEKWHTTPDTLEFYYNFTLDSHADMEEEICQVINTNNANTQVHFFENLKEWLTDFRIERVNRQQIIFEIEKYNTRKYEDFKKDTEIEVAKFRQTPNFTNYKNLEPYTETDRRNSPLSKYLFIFDNTPFSSVVINHHYYCIENDPLLLDVFYLQEYINKITPIFDNLRRIITKYVVRYDEGKILPNNQIQFEKQLALPEAKEAETKSLAASNNNPMKREALAIFIKELTYNYPHQTSAFNFKYTMIQNLDYLKLEVLDNLIIIGKDEKLHYLNRVHYEIKDKKQHANANQKDIDIWLEQFGFSSEEEIRGGRKQNELYNMLNSDPPTMDEECVEGFNRDTQTIQWDFYGFYYGFYIDAATDFLDSQIALLNPNQTNNVQDQITKENPKLKTNLSVPQLSYLFKMLMDSKPDIFDVKSKAEVYRFINANFTTIGKDEGPTVASLNNLYSNVDKDVANFWGIHLKKMVENARKI